MPELLTATSSRPAPTRAGDRAPGRPLWLSAGLAGVVSAGSVLVLCMALGLVGWFASDAGAHGDTRDALRVGADAWLLGHGGQLRLATATITAIPLGLSLVCVYVTFRLGRWAAFTSAEEDLAVTALAAVILAGLYGAVTIVVAVLASLPQAEVSLGRSFVGGVVVGLVGGGLGLFAPARAGAAAWALVPEWVRSVVAGALSVALLVVAAGAALVATALLLDLGEAANVLSRLHPDATGAGLYTLVVAGVAPNAALLGSAYLLGPGFALGSGTVVSPAMVVLGEVPAFPLLAALPSGGPGPVWATGLVAVPVVMAGVAAALVLRRFPVFTLDAGAVRGLASGVGGGLLLWLLVLAAGGAVGPGRMADIGAPGLDTLVAATVALGIGGLVGGVAATWWLRRHWTPAPDPSTEDTVIL